MEVYKSIKDKISLTAWCRAEQSLPGGPRVVCGRVYRPVDSRDGLCSGLQVVRGHLSGATVLDLLVQLNHLKQGVADKATKATPLF